MTYSFNGVTHTISEEELGAIESSGRCSLKLYIAAPEDRVETWWRVQIENERRRVLTQHKTATLTKLIRERSKLVCDRMKQRVRNIIAAKDFAAKLDKSPVIEVKKYSKEEKAARKGLGLPIEATGYRVKPHSSVGGRHMNEF